MNEILKGTISLIIAFCRIDSQLSSYESAQAPCPIRRPLVQSFQDRVRKLSKEIMSTDCWKLSIPAILYGDYLFFDLVKGTSFHPEMVGPFSLPK
jgi:UDP-sugar transporter A1/2/3